MEPNRPHPTTDGTEQREEFESIPWDALIRQPSPLAGRWPLLVAVAVGVLAVTVAVVRAYWPSPAVEPLALTAPVASAPPPTVVTPAPPPTAAALPTEADLMAIDPSALDRAAGAYAEWYTSRFFTRTGAGQAVDPHLNLEIGGFDSSIRSYVESTHAIEVEPLSASRRQVAVVVRSLVAVEPDAGFVRQPDRLVELVVRVGDDGLQVEDLPRPVTVQDPARALTDLQQIERPDLVEAARGRLAAFGSVSESPYHVGMTPSGRVRVGLVVTDESGASWPFAVWFEADGSLAP